MDRTAAAIALALAAGACRKETTEAPPAYSDALVALFVQVEDDDAVVADNLRAIERQIYLGMDVLATKTVDRALAPDHLTEADVEGLERPTERDVGAALPVSVAAVSPHEIALAQTLQLEVDHTPWEPYSPDHYVRTFEDGRDCWRDHGCTWLHTWNDLTKENLLMTVEYGFFKDFRWVDVAEQGEPRWAYVARSWQPRSYAGDNGNSFIHQSYTIEVWIPRDGRGYTRSPKDENVDDGEWTSDSSGGGTLRMLTVWTETEFKGLSVSDEAVISTTREGIDKNFEAADDYLSGL